MFAQHPYASAVTIIALVLLVALVWTLRRKPQVAAEVATARASVSAMRRILVPVRGFAHEQRAVELACRLGQEQKSQIFLVNVIEVPLSLSLGTMLAEQEESALQALQRSIELVKLHGLEPITRVERDRDAGRGILRVATELNVDLVVIGLDPARGVAVDPIGPTTETLLRRAHFEVIFDRPAPAVSD
jgi:nucleotide-binding universal stress UspA family protein